MSKVKQDAEEVVETPKVKQEPYVIVASYRVKNDIDGTFERIKHEGTGKTVEEALARIEDYPKGLNTNVLISVTHGAKAAEKSVAPHNARAILENGDLYTFERHFRGV